MNVISSTVDKAVAAELAEKIADLVVHYGQKGTATNTNAYFAMALVAGRLMTEMPEDLRKRVAADLAECALISANVELELERQDWRNETKH